jgi:hypothetical protein
MAAAGTLLADLDSAPGGGDGDLVQKILADMSAPAVQSNRPVPPPMPSFAAQPAPPLASTQNLTMDGRIPTSHMIGNEHPTPADFAAAMMSGGASAGAPYSQTPQPQQVYEAPQKNLSGRILDEVKIPFVVALLFFLFSMHPIRVLAAYYVPSLVKNTGEFTIPGLLGVSSIVGLTFWILYRVIAPLLSL